MTPKPFLREHGLRRFFPRVLTVLLLGMTLAACGHKENWKLLNLKGVMPPLEFTLHDDKGRTVTAQDYRGKIVMLYFGYTHCPDVCPTNLARMGQAVSSLGADAKKVQVLFVSVDPARDTPKVLQRYPRLFNPGFRGLSGTQAQLRSLTKRYRVTYGYGKPDAHGNYEVSHSSAVYIFDAKGNMRLMAQSSDKASDITHDLRLLINGA